MKFYINATFYIYIHTEPLISFTLHTYNTDKKKISFFGFYLFWKWLVGYCWIFSCFFKFFLVDFRLFSNKTWGTHTWQMTSEDCYCWESSKFWSNRNRNSKTRADWIDYWNHIHRCHWSNLLQFDRLDCEFWAAKIQFHPEIEKNNF